MKKTRHYIEINCPSIEVYQFCCDVESWPEYFSPCKSVNIISENNKEQIVEITAKANDKTMTWQSSRKYHPEMMSIFFQQLTPMPIIKKMRGAWRIYPTENSTLLSIEHEFQVAENPENKMEGIKSYKEAEEFMLKTIEENSQKELAAIKSHIEGRTVQNGYYNKFEEAIEIEGSSKDCFTFLWDVKAWPSLLKHCHSIDMIYEDEKHQEFIMCVETPKGREKIRTIRKQSNRNKIEYFQSTPPPVLKQHHGEWIIREGFNQSRILSKHAIRVSEDEARNIWPEFSFEESIERVVQIISKNSFDTMSAIKNILEKQA